MCSTQSFRLLNSIDSGDSSVNEQIALHDFLCEMNTFYKGSRIDPKQSILMSNLKNSHFFDIAVLKQTKLCSHTPFIGLHS